jgi:hypothetical protein
MFLGYQNDKIAFVADTREELENLPCVVFDKIEETSDEYVLHNGEYLLKSEAEVLQNQEEINKRIEELQQYLNDTDWYVARYSETGVEIPEEVKQKRAEAREEISRLRNE